jgi:transcriptional regulator with XRE-family HTH domain
MARPRNPLKIGPHAFLGDGTPSHYLRAWRVHRKLSQQEVARIMGTNASAVSKYELGELPYTQRVIEVLAAIYRCKPSDLIGTPPETEPVSELRELPSDVREEILTLLTKATSKLSKI